MTDTIDMQQTTAERAARGKAIIKELAGEVANISVELPATEPGSRSGGALIHSTHYSVTRQNLSSSCAVAIVERFRESD